MLEPFYGGSHKNFAQGLISHTRHNIDLLTLPARFWKWRMRGAALYFFKKISFNIKYDGLITTDLMSLADLKALWGASCPPSIIYFHENQLTYPLAPGDHMDFQFGFTDITTALAADRIIFNSRTHKDEFFSCLPGFLKMMPEFQPKWVHGAILHKSDFIYPGCCFEAGTAVLEEKKEDPPLIIWNHRWEFDKNPGAFFNALDEILKKGLDFRLALLGENFQKVPKDFIAAKKRYKDKILCYGYVESREEYIEWLKRGSIIISTAKQENFGISVVEAVRFGCIPVLPHRLSYPEIIPSCFHGDFLYKNETELIEKLSHIISDYEKIRIKCKPLFDAMGSFAWENIIDRYDEELEKLSQGEPFAKTPHFA